MAYIELFIICALAAIVLLVLLASLMFRDLWLQSQLSGAKLPLIKLVLLQRKGVPVRVLIDAYARTRHTDYDISFGQYLEVYHRGGNVTRVSMALASAHAAKLDLDVDEIIDIELHKMDAFDYVHQKIQEARNEAKKNILKRGRV